MKNKITGVNKYGVVSQSEFAEFVAKYAEANSNLWIRRHVVSMVESSIATVDRAKDLFNLMDRNKNGLITKSEINHAAHVDKNLLVVLNDNQMSISRNSGGLSTYFAKLWSSKFYTNLRESGKKALRSLPHAKNFVRRTEEYMKSMVSPATIFEELGFYYIGLIDGHDLPMLVSSTALSHIVL